MTKYYSVEIKRSTFIWRVAVWRLREVFPFSTAFYLIMVIMYG